MMGKLVKNFVLSFFDDDVQPNAEVSRHHVHQAKVSNGSGSTVHCHLFSIGIHAIVSLRFRVTKI